MNSKKLSVLVVVTICCQLFGCDLSGGQRAGAAEGVQRQVTSMPDQNRAEEILNVSEAKLLEEFRSKDLDRVIRVMNEVKGSRHRETLVPILLDLWNGVQLPGVEKNFLENPRVRLEIADTLAQIEKNGFKGLEKSAFAEYARALSHSSDTQVANQAMLVLGVAGSAADMLHLESLAENIAEGRFRAAAIALVSNCNTTSALLDKLEAGLKEDWRRNYLVETRIKLGPLRVCLSR